MEVDRSWWASWTSNPVGGVKSVPGGFDSHVPPPSIFKDFSISAYFLPSFLAFLNGVIVPKLCP